MADISEEFERIQRQALDSSVPLADTLRLCIAVGGRLNAPGLIAWANSELNGYEIEEELPKYRTVTAPLLMSYVLGPSRVEGQVVTANLVDLDFRATMHDVPLREPLASLEEASRGTKNSISMISANSGALSAMIKRNTRDAAFLTIMSVYWDVPRAAIGSVVDKVRTKLVTMVAEFDVAVRLPGADTAAAARDAISVVVAPGGMMNMNTADQGAIVAAGDRAVVTSNQARGHVTTATAGRDLKESTTSHTGRAAKEVPRFWETGWWTVARTIYAGVTLILVALTTWFAYLALRN